MILQMNEVNSKTYHETPLTLQEMLVTWSAHMQ